MKYLFALALGLGSVSVLVAQSKLDLSTRLLLQNNDQYEAGFDGRFLDPRVSGGRVARASGDAAAVGVIVKLKEGCEVKDLLADEDIIVVSSAGNMAVLSLPVDELEHLSTNECVESVSAGYMNHPTMYYARTSGHVDAVQSGDGLPRYFTGKNVVVGMMDQGLDPNHINFTDGGNYTTSRVKAVYAYDGRDGVPTQSATTPEEIGKFTSDNTKTSHGTHVMGIAAGSFSGNGSFGLNGKSYTNTSMPYYGIATQADIVMAGGIFSDANIISGVENVIGYAESVGKPAVVNLSLGGILGPHDGTDAMCQYLARLGERAIICIAAGNDGDNDCAMSMSGGGGGIAASLLKNNAVGFNISTTDTEPYIMQFWGNDSQEFTFDFVIYNTDTKSVVYSLPIPNTNGRQVAVGGLSTDASYNRDANFDAAFTEKSYAAFWSQVEDNNRYCVLMQCVLNRGNVTNYALMPAIRVSRVKGQTVCGYLYTPADNEVGKFVKESGSGWKDLYWGSTVCSSNGTISDMATGSNVISVGAYTSSKYFTLENGNAYLYDGATDGGQICNFSSYGTNPVTGETYPFVSAPGSAIVSSVSNYDTTDYNVCGNAGGNGRSNLWGVMQGTSMACPFVSGTMALWLEADPSLTVAEAREIIAATAVPYTGSDSNLKIKWGHGRLDALAGIKEVLRRKAEAGIDGVVADAGGYVITPVGDRGYNIVVDGAGEVTARLYNMQGVAVATATARGNEVSLQADGVGGGVYVLAVESPNMTRISRRVLLR